MTIKYTQKSKILVVVMIVVSTIVPAISQASFFDWLGNSGSDPMNYSNSVVSQGQGSLLYANSIFSQKDNGDQSQLASVLQSDFVTQPPSILSVSSGSVKSTKLTKKSIKVRVTAYSSTPDQTDGNPFITANGTHVHDGIVATNILPFKTLVKIPELFGDKVFVVEDRMNARYTNVVDVWFPDRQSALNLGSRHATLEVVGSL